MGAGASTSAPQNLQVDGPRVEWLEYECTYCEWGQLGLTIEPDRSISAINQIG